MPVIFEDNAISGGGDQPLIDGNKKHIRAYTREAMRETAFDKKQAIQLLLSRAEEDRVLRDHLLKLGADQAIRTYFHEERSRDRDLINPTASSPAPTRQPLKEAERVERREAHIQKRLFWDRYALFGHKQLRQATRPDLRQSIANRKKQNDGNLRCMGFEADIMKKLPNDQKRVDQHLRISEVIEIAKAHRVV